MKKLITVFIVSLLLSIKGIAGAEIAQFVADHRENSFERIGLSLASDLALIERYSAAPSENLRSVLEHYKLPLEPDSRLRVFVYLKEMPDKNAMDKLEARGFELFPESWIPPVGAHKNGFMLARINTSNIREASSENLVERVAAAYRKFEPLNDAAAFETGAVFARGEEFDLSGEGVRLAIIDSGFELTHQGRIGHPDLPTPDGFVAVDYSRYPDRIGNDVTDHWIGHGTHVAGTAFGTGGLSDEHFQGMASGITPIYIKIGHDSLGGSASEAAIIGAFKACVDEFDADIISLSYGYSMLTGEIWGDGSDPIDQVVDYAVSRGATVFVAAGNDGDIGAMHYYGSVSPGASSRPIEIRWRSIFDWGCWPRIRLTWYDDADPDVHIPLTLHCIDEDGDEIPGEFFEGSSPRGTEAASFMSDGFLPYTERGSFWVVVTNHSNREQDFHLLNFSLWITEFAEPNNSYSITSPATADSAIAVGAYTSRSVYTDYHGVEHNDEETSYGSLAAFSSRGPRIDGLMKPDIAAPGQHLISSRDRNTIFLGGMSDQSIVGNDGGEGEPADYLVAAGTSMASPAAAGSAALMMQAARNEGWDITPAELRQLISSSARRDRFTGSQQNPNWGWGKIDVMRFLEALQKLYSNPISMVLEPAYPNPFNSKVRLRFSLREARRGSLVIHDLGGRVVSVFYNDVILDGAYNLVWDASYLSSGTYLAKLTAENEPPQTIRIILLK